MLRGGGHVISGSETELYMYYPIKAGRNYTARVKTYVETTIGQHGQPGANYIDWCHPLYVLV